MSDESTAGKVYTTVRSHILSGEYLPGVWVKQSILAKRLEVGEMPLRFACYALATHGLIEKHTHRGLYIRDLKGKNIQAKLDMLREDLMMILDAVIHGRGEMRLAMPLDLLPETSLADAYGLLFQGIARMCGNYMRERSIADIVARLQIVRHLETRVIGGAKSEFDALHLAYASNDWTVLRRLLRTYFQRRTKLIPSVIVQIHELREQVIS